MRSCAEVRESALLALSSNLLAVAIRPRAAGLLLGLALLAACGGSDTSADGSDVGDVFGSAGTPAAASGAGSSASAPARSGPAGSAAAPVSAVSGLAGSASTGNAAGSQAVAGAGSSLPVAAGSGTAGAAGASTPSVVSAAAGSGGSPAAMPDTAASGVEPASCKGDRSGKAPVIYVIGDSTASVYDAKLYPRMGWAQPLQEYFKPACATVQDKALSGRSSKSFFDEGAWTPIRAALHEGDFVLIQFGHNDEKAEDSARYTEPFGSYQEQLSKYIDDTLAAKATPILLTSIERNKWSSGKLSATHGDYPEAVRQLAKQRMLSLVDMTQLTHTYLEGIGEAASTKLFLNLAPGESPNYPSGNSDDTHLQDKGAHKIAEIALADIARQRLPIAALLDHVPAP